MEHSSGVVLHFSLFEVEIFRLVISQARGQADAIAVLVTTTASTRRPVQISQLETAFIKYMQFASKLRIYVNHLEF